MGKSDDKPEVNMCGCVELKASGLAIEFNDLSKIGVPSRNLPNN